MKRKQRVQKPCDLASKFSLTEVFVFDIAGTAPKHREWQDAAVRSEYDIMAYVQQDFRETWESLPPPHFDKLNDQ